LASKRLLAACAAVAVLAGLAAQSGAPARGLMKGIYDEPEVLYGNPEWTFPMLRTLRADVLRVNLYWGGNKIGVAETRPSRATDPGDPAYEWEVYDRAVLYAAQYRIQVLFSIVGTPRWANGGKAFSSAPTKMTDLRNFAYAAARRYNGAYARVEDGRVLPRVRLWLAWNEPNNPVFLRPQFTSRRIASARTYAKICAAVSQGVRMTLARSQRVACGATAPRGNNIPTGARGSVSPLAFLRALKAAGLKRTAFDAYAHHPYYGGPAEEPTKRPPSAGAAKATAVTLGNIADLDAELRRLFGPKRIWITEYGYQTNPPDRRFGVPWALQSKYLTQAYAIARAHPRIDMMLWFPLKDEPRLEGWQSGLMTPTSRKKPAFNAFLRVP
jgi:hypothetical protein